MHLGWTYQNCHEQIAVTCPMIENQNINKHEDFHCVVCSYCLGEFFLEKHKHTHIHEHYNIHYVMCIHTRRMHNIYVNDILYIDIV